jgi:hypothetical protein
MTIELKIIVETLKFHDNIPDLVGNASLAGSCRGGRQFKNFWACK